MDLYFQGLAWLNKGYSPSNVAQAHGFFDRALTADPDNVDPLVGSARANVVEGASSFGTDPTVAFTSAEAKLTKALSSVPDHAVGHMWLGLVNIYTKRAEEGIAKCKHALALDRNLAHAHHAIGFGKIFSGHTEETEAHINEALRLSPRDTMAYVWITFVGLAKLHLGNCEQAVASFRQAVEANRNYPIAYLMLAVALAKLGRLDEARSAVRAALTFNPDFSISRARSAWTAMSDDPTFLTLLDIIFDGLRKAGVPE
jgi:tetratricopeptide (TPR) repeat protein